MPCSICGSEKSGRYKHLPTQDGWIELSEFTEYCTPCAKAEVVKLEEIFKKAKEAT